mmetsp:Transcript_3009/g.6674  ORF Transcript_3009/g.6674 Transcript_3009/m.6674 type:complete len:208 (-) Transcript_3009:581-1204(-)
MLGSSMGDVSGDTVVASAESSTSMKMDESKGKLSFAAGLPASNSAAMEHKRTSPSFPSLTSVTFSAPAKFVISPRGARFFAAAKACDDVLRTPDCSSDPLFSTVGMNSGALAHISLPGAKDHLLCVPMWSPSALSLHTLSKSICISWREVECNTCDMLVMSNSCAIMSKELIGGESIAIGVVDKGHIIESEWPLLSMLTQSYCDDAG